LTIRDHAALALINIEYAVAECDLMSGVESGNVTRSQITFVKNQLALAKTYLQYILDQREPSHLPSETGTYH